LLVPARSRDETMLMPHSAPSPEGLPPRPPSRSRIEAAAVDGRRNDERAVLRLSAQLHALEHDIQTARTIARRAGEPGRLLPAHVDAPVSRPAGERAHLRDGTEILIRPIEREDADGLRGGFERLSAVSRYRRFLSEIDHLTSHQVEYLTRLDHQDHEAFGVLVAATGDGIAIGRFVRDPADRRQADVAIVVADDWQGRGVGTALLERLARRARSMGIERVTARMLAGNVAASRLIVGIGEVVGERRRGGTIELTLRLR
jgi:GNAT superfamily N-acetyltransferase